MRSISDGEQRSILVQGILKKRKKNECDVQGFLSYNANFLHAQPTGKLAWRIKRKK
jgi:hypothetical protein